MSYQGTRVFTVLLLFVVVSLLVVFSWGDSFGLVVPESVYVGESVVLEVLAPEGADVDFSVKAPDGSDESFVLENIGSFSHLYTPIAPGEYRVFVSFMVDGELVSYSGVFSAVEARSTTSSTTSSTLPETSTATSTSESLTLSVTSTKTTTDSTSPDDIYFLQVDDSFILGETVEIAVRVPEVSGVDLSVEAPDGSTEHLVLEDIGSFTHLYMPQETGIHQVIVVFDKLASLTDSFNVLSKQTTTILSDRSSDPHPLAGGPNIMDVSPSPPVQGYGLDVVLQANVSDADGVDRAWVEITSPAGSPSNHSMFNNSKDIWNFNYKNWVNGTYFFKVYGNDSLGNQENSSSYEFNLSVDLAVNVRTLLANYSTEDVNLSFEPMHRWTDITDLSSCSDKGWAVAVDSLENVIVTGEYDLWCDLADHMIFTQKLNSSGGILWTYTTNPPGSMSSGYGVATDSLENVIVTGYCVGCGDKGLYSIYTRKYNSSGGLLWDNIYDPTAGIDKGQGVATDSLENVIVTGYCTGCGGLGGAAIYLLKYNSSGSILWTDITDPTAGDDLSYGVAVDSAGDVYVSGYCHGCGGGGDAIYTMRFDSESSIWDTYTTNSSLYLLMTVDYWNGSHWLMDDVVVSDSTPRQVNTTDIIKLWGDFNGRWNAQDNASFGDGLYRVYAAAQDNESNILFSRDGSPLNASWVFNVSYTLSDKSPPSWSSNSTNGSCTGCFIEHRVRWTDNINLSGYIFSWFNGSNWTEYNTSGDLEPGKMNIAASCITNGSTKSPDQEPSVQNVNSSFTWGTTQYARPISDNLTGLWDDPGGNNNNILYDDIDEVAASDADYVTSSGNPAADAFEVSLTALSDPETSGGHNVSYRYLTWETGGGQPAILDYAVSLIQGSTVIASWSHNGIDPPTAWSTVTQNLAAGEADSITDYGDLRLRFNVTQTQGARVAGVNVSWAQLEVPRAKNKDVDVNQSGGNYSNVDDTAFNNASLINVTVYVSGYSSMGSTAAGNNNPDLRLWLFNGSNWVDAGLFGVTGAGNHSVASTESTILSAWSDAVNRKINITGAYLDYYNSTHWDEINWSGVWVNTSFFNESDYEANRSGKNYSSVLGGDLYRHIHNITVTVYVDGYGSAGSVAAGNTNPDLFLEIRNSTGWVNVSVYGVAGAGNHSVTVTDSSVLDAWGDEGIRDIKVDLVYVDCFNSTAFDEINWSGVWVGVGSHQVYLNDSWQVFPGAPVNVSWSNVTKGVSSNVGDLIRWLVYANDSSNLWNQSDVFSYVVSSLYGSLVIWDDGDVGSAVVGEQVGFYANYSNASSGEPINGSGVYCDISFGVVPSGPFTMDYNPTTLLYEYNRTFSAEGVYGWNVSCNGSSQGHDTQFREDTVSISLCNLYCYNCSNCNSFRERQVCFHYERSP